MQANLIFQGSHDFYFPKYFGVIPNIARAVNSLVQLLSIGWGKKEKKIPFSNMNVTKKKKIPARTDQCPFSPAVCLQKIKEETLCRESNQSYLWFTTLIPTPCHGIRNLSLWTCWYLSAPTVSPQSLTKTGFPSVVVHFPHFFLLQGTGSPQNSLHLPEELALCKC